MVASNVGDGHGQVCPGIRMMQKNGPRGALPLPFERQRLSGPVQFDGLGGGNTFHEQGVGQVRLTVSFDWIVEVEVEAVIDVAQSRGDHLHYLFQPSPWLSDLPHLRIAGASPTPSFTLDRVKRRLHRVEIDVLDLNAVVGSIGRDSDAH